MLLVGDAKQLEWIGATYLSQDKVAIDEINREVDMHADNQERFNLPTRLIAKTFVFRLIYGGSAYSYSVDPNFREIGNEAFWQDVIDKFYTKYSGLKKWHEEILHTATRDRQLVMPTGRIYPFEPEVRYGKVKYPRTKIMNYPVQGLGADLMAIARVSLRNRLKGWKSLDIINTVHDSIVIDFDDKVCYTDDLVKLVDTCFNDIPENFKKLFGVDFNLPMRVECQIGKTWGTMEVIEVKH
jgi:DNA polymerase I-like protein with 3'-5' exonuclease and polymerase domains